MIQCSRCNELKDPSLFNKNAKNASGRSVWCRSCNRENGKIWREANKDHLTELLRSTKRRYTLSQHRSRYRDLEWTLTIEQFSDLISKKCYYCDDLLGKSSVTGSGLDRIDNNLGYTLENVVSCCFVCNRLKREFYSMGETKAMVQVVLKLRNLI